MRIQHSVPAAAGLVAFALACAVPATTGARAQGDDRKGDEKAPDEKKQPEGDTKVNEDEKKWPLPFGIAEKDLPEVEVSLELFRSKAGAGSQRITVQGTGKVELWRTASYNAKPEILEGKVPVTSVVRFLELCEAEGLPGFKDRYLAEEQPPGRTFALKLKRPGAPEKLVAVEDWEVQPVARVSGALRLLAALARPEAIGERFFKSF